MMHGQNSEVVILVEKQLSQYSVITNNHNNDEPAREHTQNWSFIKTEITFLKQLLSLLTKSNNKSAQNGAHICLTQEVIHPF